MKKVYSFDVFDTVVTRLVGDPDSLFLLLGYRLSESARIRCTPEVFARSRLEAEWRARKHSDREDIELDSIYRELAGVFADSADCMEAWREEMSLEEELIRPIPEMCERVESMRKEGKRVIFVSDIYLPAGFVRKLLLHHGILKEGDNLYVSSECGLRKATGNLFAKIAGAEEPDGAAFVHTGDNPNGDVEQARKNGWKGVLYTGAQMNRHELRLESYAWASGGLSSLLAGASRMARLTAPSASERERGVRDVAASVAGPLLAGFVMWLFQRAERKGIKRLYFVAREGQILMKVAKRFQRYVNSGIELRYVYGSRQAWLLPEISEGVLRDFDWLNLAVAKNQTVRSILDLGGVDPEELHDVLVSEGFPPECWDEELRTGDSQARLKEMLNKSPVLDLIIERAKHRSELLHAYLRQEGFLDGVPSALVDSGWNGRHQSAVNRTLGLKDDARIKGFYLGIFDHGKGALEGEEEGYLFDRASSIGFLMDHIPIVRLVEMFCIADHGTLAKYKTGPGGGVEPVFKNAMIVKALEDWGIREYHETICSFADNFFSFSGLRNRTGDVRKPCIEAVASFWRNPSESEVCGWRSFPFDFEREGQPAVYLAEPIAVRDIIRSFRRGKIVAKNRWSWKSACWKITPLPTRILTKAAVRMSPFKRGRFKRLSKMFKSTPVNEVNSRRKTAIRESNP